MAHLITSHKGADHVESKHAAHWNAGTLGNGCYVLPIGSKLACTMTDSNTLRVLFGVGSVCGYDWEIEGDYEEVDIDNGVPGYNRIDLLVARVETAPAEKVELRVYKGEETTGTPVQPGYVQGDLNDGDTVCEMPICSVRVNGINPQAPEMLAKESIDIMALLEELRDYKSQMQTAGGINAGGIAGAKLAAGAVTSEKIKDGSIASVDIAANAVTADKLAANAVTSAKLDAATRDVLSRCVRRTYADETLLATYHVAATVPASGVYTYSVAADFKNIGLAVAQINESSSSLVCNSCIVSGTSVQIGVRKAADGTAYSGAARIKLLVIGAPKSA